MLYSEKELEKRLKAGCALYYFYASDEALVHTAAQKTLKYLNRDDPETTVLDGPTPSVEEIVLAAGTISFFGGKRLVLMPLIRPSTYSDKDLQELCDTLADTENAIFVLTSIIEESYGKLRPGKREQKLIASCEKLGYCVQLNRPTGAALQAMARDWAKEAGADFAPGAEAALLARCGEDQFLLKNEVEKLAALANYSTITKEMVSRLGTVTLDADTFDMVKLLTSGQADKAQQKLKTLLALQKRADHDYRRTHQQLSGSVPRAAGPPQPPGPRRCGQGLWLQGQLELPPQFYRKKPRCASSVPSWRTACTSCKDWTPT